jgi:hypothetical protein
MTGLVVQRVALVLLVLFDLFSAPAWAQQPVTGLSITIVEGEGALNNIRDRVNRDSIVQVDDQDHRPVAGAAVTFFLPQQGPSGTFPNGSRMLMTVTDGQGRATARGIRPNSQSGPMQIRVTASFQGLTASSVITQTNAATGPTTAGRGMSRGAKWAIILAIAGGAAAGGIAAATHGGSSTGGSSTPPAIVISPGTPTVGAP